MFCSIEHRAACRDETDTSCQIKTKKVTKKHSKVVEKSDKYVAGSGPEKRQSLSVLKSKTGSVEASPNKRRKNSDQSK